MFLLLSFFPYLLQTDTTSIFLQSWFAEMMKQAPFFGCLFILIIFFFRVFDKRFSEYNTILLTISKQIAEQIAENRALLTQINQTSMQNQNSIQAVAVQMAVLSEQAHARGDDDDSNDRKKGD
jgi:hypothetical protein